MSTYDIFISYRRDGSEDFARAVYQDLIHRKYKAFLDRQDLLAGIYEEQIHTVIEQVKDVIIILPQNALDRCTGENDLFRKEIAHAISANKNIILIMRQGFEFPNTEKLPEEIRLIPKFEAIKETPDHFNDAIIRLLELLKSKTGIKKTQLHFASTATTIEVLLKNQNLSPCTSKNIYIPRKKACDTIYERLNQYHILYLHAIRGNGKSETAREYAEIYADEYDFVQLAFYSQNLKKTIANLDFVGLKYEDKIAKTDDDIDRLYSYKLDLLSNTDIYTSNTLLIIDNYDYNSSPESEEYKKNAKVLSDLKKLHIHIVFTTRINPADRNHCFKLEDMSKTELEQLFFKINPVRKDDPKRQKLVDEIIKASYNHTMTVKLVALQSKKYKKDLEEYLSVLKENGINSHIQSKITNEKDDESITMSAVYDHIKALFDFDNLSDKEKYVMVNACLLPLEAMSST